jgi:hypothetical protein
MVEVSVGSGRRNINAMIVKKYEKYLFIRAFVAYLSICIQ